jgi:glycosyltransferase involved in cell wall biosynthesis
MKICFWGDIASALTGNTAGGGELQTALLAKALAKAGHEVVVIDYNVKESFVTHDGIKVFGIIGWNKGLKIIRSLTHRLPELYRSLKAQKADVYYCRIRDFRHILAYWAARKVKGKFILGLASDLDAMNFIMRLKYYHLVSSGSLWSFSSGMLIEIIYPFLIRKADLVLVQHEGQKAILAKKNIHCCVFPNLIEPNQPEPASADLPEHFIYVGSLDKRKGFGDFFNLVTRTPGYLYKVVGRPRDKTAHLHYGKLKSFKNVLLLGRLSHAETMFQIANSKALISTSPMEGFPNIFIEAWACGVPVLSLYVDPGDIIKREELGEVAHGNLDKLLLSIDTVQNANDFSKRAKLYVERNHLLNANKIKEISLLFSGLLGSRKS